MSDQEGNQPRLIPNQLIDFSRSELPNHFNARRPKLPELHLVCRNDCVTLEEIKRNLNDHEGSKRWGMEVDFAGKSSLEFLVKNPNATREMIEYVVTQCPDSCGIGEGWNPFDLVLDREDFDLAKMMLSKASRFIRINDSILRSIENAKIIKFLLDERPKVFEEMDHALVFARLFSMRSEGQLEIFRLLVERLGKDVTKKSLSGTALKDFFKQCQDEFNHELIIEEFEKVFDEELFEFRDELNNSVLHYLCKSSQYGMNKCISKFVELDRKNKAFCTNNENMTPIHTILRSRSLIHFEDGRGLFPLKIILKKYRDQVLEYSDRNRGRNDLFVEFYISTINTGIHGTPSNDMHRDLYAEEEVQSFAQKCLSQRVEILDLLVASSIHKNMKKRELVRICSTEIQSSLWKSGYIEILHALKRHGSEIRPEPFFDQRNNEITFSLGETLVSPKYGYGGVKSYQGYSKEDITMKKKKKKPEDFFRMILMIEKLSKKGGFVGCLLSNSGLSTYLGNADASSSFNLGDGMTLQTSKKEKLSKFAKYGGKIKEGDVLECLLYPKKKKFVIHVNPNRRHDDDEESKKIPNNNNTIEIKNVISRSGEKIHFGIGMFKGTEIRVLETTWSTKNHKDFPKEFREIIKQFLMVHNREDCFVSSSQGCSNLRFVQVYQSLLVLIFRIVCL